MFPTYKSLRCIFESKETCLDYLSAHGAFDIPDACDKCGGRVAIHCTFWKCTTKNCRRQASFLTTSFFGQSRLPVNEVMELGYYWLAQCSRESLLRITGHSPNTVSDYMAHYRQLVGESLDTDDTVVGGPGISVYVDESKFGRRKYNRGHRVEGVWVIGGVDSTPERNMFAETIETRDRDSIVAALTRHIAPESIVVTDCWRGYSGIDEALSVRHMTVNHSAGFVNPENNACTNAIEGTWAGMKNRIPARCRTRNHIEGHLLEYIWRRRHRDNLWNALVNCFSVVGY
jgi:hypothetical protein